MQQGQFNKIREAQAKADLIGVIHNSEVYELLGFHLATTAGEKESWTAFMEALGSVAGDVFANKRNHVEDMAQNFGNEREETGFRLSFHMTMRLCMEGMNGGCQIMDGVLMKELAAIQNEMVAMEGMMEALIKSAYNGTRVEYIGNSLEILKDYLEQRSDRLDGLIKIPVE